MLLDTIFAPFVKERPICVMARAVLERLLDAPRIDALFARTAQQQYTRELMFSSLVQLMSEVVLGVHPTVHAAYQANKAAIGVSTTALYNKLDRVETGVSAALVRDSAELAEPVVKALRASHPRWLPGYQLKVLDGNHLSSTAHRLKLAVRARDEAKHDRAQLRAGPMPATRVAGQRDAAAPVELRHDKRPVADRLAGLRIDDALLAFPDRGQVLVLQRVRREDVIEETPPCGERLLECDLHDLAASRDVAYVLPAFSRDMSAVLRIDLLQPR